MYYSKCHGELPFLAFSGFRPTATRLRSCSCYSWLKASTVLPKEVLISLSANSPTGLKRLSDFVRLVGGLRNIYGWIFAFGLILGTGRSLQTYRLVESRHGCRSTWRPRPGHCGLCGVRVPPARFDTPSPSPRRSLPEGLGTSLVA